MLPETAEAIASRRLQSASQVPSLVSAVLVTVKVGGRSLSVMFTVTEATDIPLYTGSELLTVCVIVPV